MKDLVEGLAKSLPNNPEEVPVREVAGDASVALDLRVGEGDLGKIIGKHSNNIRVR